MLLWVSSVFTMCLVQWARRWRVRGALRLLWFTRTWWSRRSVRSTFLLNNVWTRHCLIYWKLLDKTLVSLSISGQFWDRSSENTENMEMKTELRISCQASWLKYAQLTLVKSFLATAFKIVFNTISIFMETRPSTNSTSSVVTQLLHGCFELDIG